MAKSKKKITTAVVAGVTAVALLLGGTFAWQSINQTALNESADVVNPGGRLHDDFNGSNKDVYVENFADENIFARVRLEEFFEITQAGGTVHSIAGTRIDEDNVEYVLHDFYNENATDAYWNWQTGGSTVFMPTFNKNKDSLVADVNGTYDSVDDEGKRYSDYYEYVLNEKKKADAIYDYDSNDADEVGSDFDNLGAYSENVTTVTEEHTAKNTLGATLISMDEWIAQGSPVGEYWVYDTDGWVYWADAIKPGEATGLLLDGISLKDKLDDSWYYAINVIAQFVTADDLGAEDGSGFYDSTAGTPPTDAAIELLKQIGAITEENNVDDAEQVYSMHTYVFEGDHFYGNANYLVPDKTYTVIVHAVENEYDDEYVTFKVTKQDGTPLKAGTDYSLSDTKATFGDELDEQGYYHTDTVELTILNHKMVGEYIIVSAVADSTGNTSVNEVSVNYEMLDVNITLYDSNGNTVAGTGTGATIKPNATYDVVGTITGTDGVEYVIYSSLASKPVDAFLQIPSCSVYAHSGDYYEQNYINENGQLVVGDSETFDCDEWMDDGITNWDALTLSVGADIVRVYESVDAMNSGAEPFAIYYTYGQWDLYPEGQEKYAVSMDDNIYVSQGNNTADLIVLDGNDRVITDKEDLTVTLVGNTDPNTKLELLPATEGSLAYYRLTLGAKETAETLTITAQDSNGKDSRDVTIHYVGALKIGDSIADRWNDIYITSSNIATSKEVSLIDYWNAPIADATFSLSGQNNPDTHIDGNTLYIGANEGAWPMMLSVTVDGITTDYNVYVNYIADETAPTVTFSNYVQTHANVTIGGLSDADFSLTVYAYKQTDADGTFASDAHSSFTISLSNGELMFTEKDVSYIHNPSYNAETGELNFIYYAGSDGLEDYSELAVGLKLVVTDVAGNSGEYNLSWTYSAGCFVAGTQVQTVNGLLNVEDIKVGDKVYSIDLATGETVVNPVTWVQENILADAVYTINAGSETITVTGKHPFYVNGKGWVEAEDLTVGDMLVNMDGDEVVISDIVFTQLDEPVQVYNFTVDGTHNYLITESGILVHNKVIED